MVAVPDRHDVVALGRASNAAFDVTRDTGRSAALNSMAEASRAMSVSDTNHCAESELEAQGAILHCIFGNPFVFITVNSLWITPAVLSLATTIYGERDFKRMLELADALKQAGCPSAEILEHCRNDGDHVRGCWVIDLVLGKR
jgi:hypothetical protein